MSAFREVVSSSDVLKEFPRYTQVGDDTPDFDSMVITNEPTWAEPHSYSSNLPRHDSANLPKPIPMKEFPPPSRSDSSRDSMEDLSVDFGNVEEDDIAREKLDVRIRRTPDLMLELPHTQAPHVSDYQKVGESKAFTSSFRDRSYQVLPTSSLKKPSIHFSLYFYEKHHVLIVHILKAVHLPTKRSEFACNPFVQVYLLPNKTEVQESCTVNQSLNPAFDQTLRFTYVSLEMLKHQTLVFRVYINDTQHFIGGVLYPLETADLFGSANAVDMIKFDEQEGLKVGPCSSTIMSANSGSLFEQTSLLRTCVLKMITVCSITIVVITM